MPASAPLVIAPLIHVRNREAKPLEIFPKMPHGDPRWSEIREYFSLVA